MDGHFKRQKDTARIIFLHYKSSCLKNLHKQDVNAKHRSAIKFYFSLCEHKIARFTLRNQAGHQTDLPRDLSVSPGSKCCFFCSKNELEIRAGTRWSQQNPGICRLLITFVLPSIKGQTRLLSTCNRVKTFRTLNIWFQRLRRREDGV